ncbi:glycosyltransferase family 2 protein [Klebsiella aerogenes]|uniref:glycosyltransferase family 2 protein n=1 Tax=Klebsiella aerogenes TaxID=548 RepID=UPI00063CC211|nr:glycosyltransferase family 2 protein [Klebsiella aerogenes]KLF68657.1 glycosyltransferase [Klebsiella aerogenes]
MNDTLAIVVPCFNEEECLETCINSLSGILLKLIEKEKISSQSHIIFSDDGSTDKTWEIIQHHSTLTSMVKGIKLSRNKGHQIALFAGLSQANADITISIDADLQDDITVIEQMVDAYHAGYDIVYGVRNDRTTDTLFKRKTAEIFYNLMSLMGVEQVKNHADFRLMSRRAVKALVEHNEQNMYLRGLVPLVGFNSTNVYYSRLERFAGESKYPFKKMLSLALGGITSFSVTPLRIITAVGFSISVLSFILALYAVISKLNGNTVQGWTSVIIAIFFLGGIQMLCIGIIGEYVGKIYMESKKRPKYFIDKTTSNQQENK